MNAIFQLIQKLLVRSLIPMLVGYAFASMAFGQACRVETDSISDGNNATEYSLYYYNAQDLLVKKATVDSAGTSVGSYDSLFYSATRLDSVYSYSYWNGMASVHEKTIFTYNGDGQITYIFSSGDNGNGPWTKGYDLFYNPAGQLTDLKLNAFSISGNTDGFNGNFENLVWANGNLMAADLVIDFGGGVDTLELSLTYDDKKNLERHFYLQEGPDILFHSNVNNVLQVIFDNDEDMGPAGSVAVDRTYTYHPNDEVASRIDIPALFENKGRTTLYTFDASCMSTSAQKRLPSMEVNVFPNPAGNILNIDLDQVTGISSLRIIDVQGRVVATRSLESNQVRLDLSRVPAGIYILEIRNGTLMYHQKLVKL